LQGGEYFVTFFPDFTGAFLTITLRRRLEIKIRFHGGFDGMILLLAQTGFARCGQHVRVGGKGWPGFGELVGGYIEAVGSARRPT
jgi:hypothetical protein